MISLIKSTALEYARKINTVSVNLSKVQSLLRLNIHLQSPTHQVHHVLRIGIPLQFICHGIGPTMMAVHVSKVTNWNTAMLLTTHIGRVLVIIS
ncbi:hypothetical protein NQ314_016328 [Rhamnusium bicolor]|uniref:Uncharacterized protein n=1 Tax=Rhamnusium bicolor TaxID=1586634 RepID=A0AAV8WXB6_9CUCU|nr:hypothetical protein NQ314_016328 [Rhamnusium bicolor]